jgi:hypothetical protein
MGWTVRRSGPREDAIFRSRPDRPRGPPSLLYKGYQIFRGVKAAGSVASGLELYFRLPTVNAEGPGGSVVVKALRY